MVTTTPGMTRLDQFLAYVEANRFAVCVVAGALIALTAAADWLLPNTSVGFLYLLPLLVSAPALNRKQIAVLAMLCAFLREAFDPLQGAVQGGAVVPVVFNPLEW